MIDEDRYSDTWQALEDVDSAFNHISHLEFLIDELQEAVDNDRRLDVISISACLTSFIPVFTETFDRKWSACRRMLMNPE